MKRKPGRKKANDGPAALRALRRSARRAVELAKRTRTPAYVLRGDEVVNIATNRARAKKTPL